MLIDVALGNCANAAGRMTDRGRRDGMHDPSGTQRWRLQSTDEVTLVVEVTGIAATAVLCAGRVARGGETGDAGTTKVARGLLREQSLWTRAVGNQSLLIGTNQDDCDPSNTALKAGYNPKSMVTETGTVDEPRNRTPAHPHLAAASQIEKQSGTNGMPQVFQYLLNMSSPLDKN